MKRFNLVQIITVILLLVQIVYTQADNQGVDVKKVGQTSMNFLQVNVIPRAVAMGDAYTSVGEGIQSVFYNPAGLSEMDNQFEIVLATTRWIADINYYIGGISWNMGTYGALGLSFLSVDYGDIIGTSLLYVDEGSTDNLGYRETGMVENVGAYYIGLSYARSISDVFRMGFTVRYANQQLGRSELASGVQDNEQGKFVFDLGVKYYTPIESFRFAMSMRNFSTQVKYEEVSAYLPMTFAVGAAIDLMTFIDPDHDEKDALLASVEFTHPNNYTERIRMGLEYTLLGIFALRGGYNTNHDVGGLSLGFGVSGEIMKTTGDISYSYSSMDLFDDVHRFSILFAF